MHNNRGGREMMIQAIVALATLFAFTIWLPLSALLWFRVLDEIQRSRRGCGERRMRDER